MNFMITSNTGSSRDCVGSTAWERRLYLTAVVDCHAVLLRRLFCGDISAQQRQLVNVDCVPFKDLTLARLHV